MSHASPLVAILGGGQLGRMLGLAAIPLGVRCRFLDPMTDPAGCPGSAVGEVVAGEFDDRTALDALIRDADVLTYEFENIPAEHLGRLGSRVPIAPSLSALRTAQDRMREKQAFASCGVETNACAFWDPQSDRREDLLSAVETVGLPAVIKTRWSGYDGKFQGVLRSMDGLDPLLATLPRLPLIVEAFVEFRRELSIVGARGRDGSTAFYPLVQNTHEKGILRRTVAPAPGVPPVLQASAERAARSIMEDLGYVGVMALELFEDQDGTLLANEIAPRVHNTGHWTIEGAATSQFENHLRAILGWPLGETEPVGHSVMVNLIGERPDAADVLAIPGASYHWYGKAVRPGRKVGHVTVSARSAAEAEHRARQVEALLAIGDD